MLLSTLKLFTQNNRIATTDYFPFGVNSFERRILTCLWCETQLCVFYFQDAELRVLSTYSEDINIKKDADYLKVKRQYFHVSTTFMFPLLYIQRSNGLVALTHCTNSPYIVY